MKSKRARPLVASEGVNTRQGVVVGGGGGGGEGEGEGKGGGDHDVLAAAKAALAGVGDVSPVLIMLPGTSATGNVPFHHGGGDENVCHPHAGVKRGWRDDDLVSAADMLIE